MLLFSLGSQEALFTVRHVPLGGRGSLEGNEYNPLNYFYEAAARPYQIMNNTITRLFCGEKRSIPSFSLPRREGDT